MNRNHPNGAATAQPQSETWRTELRPLIIAMMQEGMSDDEIRTELGRNDVDGDILTARLQWQAEAQKMRDAASNEGALQPVTLAELLQMELKPRASILGGLLFATGDAGRDLISLRAYLDAVRQGDAARLIAKELGP